MVQGGVSRAAEGGPPSAAQPRTTTLDVVAITRRRCRAPDPVAANGDGLATTGTPTRKAVGEELPHRRSSGSGSASARRTGNSPPPCPTLPLPCLGSLEQLDQLLPQLRSGNGGRRGAPGRAPHRHESAPSLQGHLDVPKTIQASGSRSKNAQRRSAAVLPAAIHLEVSDRLRCYVIDLPPRPSLTRRTGFWTARA